MSLLKTIIVHLTHLGFSRIFNVNSRSLYLFILFSISCSSRTRVSEDTVMETIEEGPLRIVDSLAASSLRLVDFWTCPDSVVVELNNPYDEAIVLDDEYYIYEVDSDSLLLKDTHHKIIIDPKDSCIFNVSIGLDSIWYYKDKTYRFLFPGKCNDRDVIYHYSKLKLGYMNRYKDMDVGIPDSIILCQIRYFDKLRTNIF